MPRCALPATLARAALLSGVTFGVTFGVLFSASAHAQIARNFPPTALRGALEITAPPDALLNGQPVRLAPGSRIRAANNMLQLSASLVQQPLLVHYTVDPLGLVKDVWVLSPDEAAKRPWPSNPTEAQRWLFDAPAQTWTKR